MAKSDPHAVVSPRDALTRLLDGAQTLFREHLALAKVELKEDVRRAGRDVLLSAAGLPPLLIGYALLMVALALLLAQALPSWVAFAVVAVVNLAAGGGLTLAFMNKVRRDKIALPATEQELRRDKEWIASLRETGGRPVPTGDGQAAPTREPEPPHPSALPAGKVGATPDLGPRSRIRTPGQPVGGATSAPNGEPMMAERNDPLRH